jgi:NAD-dependent DNA ligase
MGKFAGPLDHYKRCEWTPGILQLNNDKRYNKENKQAIFLCAYCHGTVKRKIKGEVALYCPNEECMTLVSLEDKLPRQGEWDPRWVE